MKLGSSAAYGTHNGTNETLNTLAELNVDSMPLNQEDQEKSKPSMDRSSSSECVL